MKYFAHPTAIIEDGADIGEGCMIWAHSHISATAQIGKGCTIGENVYIGKLVVLGNHCKVQNGVNLYTGVTAEDYVFFGPAVQTTNENHIGLLDRFGNPNTSWELGYTHFKRGAAIGSNATIRCGSRNNPTVIGVQSVVGSGSVVTKSVPDFTTVVGNPAKIMEK